MIRRVAIFAALLLGGVAYAADQATPPLSFVAGKLQQWIATDRLLGRDTTGTGAVEELTVGGGIEFTGSGGIQRGALTGDVTASAGSGTTAIAAGAIVNADINASAAIDVSKTALSPGVGIGLSGNTLSFAFTEITGPQTWGDSSGTMSWTFNAGVNDPIIDFYGSGVVDVTGTLQMNTVPVVTESGTQTLTSKTLTSPTVNTPQLNLTNSTTPAPTAEGRVEWDSDTHILAVGNGGSTSYAATGDNTGAATSLASNVVSSGKVQDGTIAANDMTEGFIASYAGTGLAVDTTTSPDTLKVGANGVTLGTDTVGNYVATIAGTTNEVSVSGSGSETAAVTVGLPSTVDLGGKTSFEVPNGSGPTTSAFGQIAGDNDAWGASRGAAQWYDGTANTYLVGALVSDTPANGQVPKYNTGGTITWESDSGGGAHEVTASSLGLHCAYSANDTATLRAALESGGAAAGKTLFIPSGCKILLGTPGSGDAVAELASGTTIQCEDASAGFVLARKSCSAVSDTPGAACENDAQCTGGTCDPDYPAGGSFAPTSSDTYTLFGAASGASNIALRRCSVWANGASKDYGYRGGTGKRWGYCDGSGPTDVLGQGCVTTCNSSSGVLYGLACTADSDCGGNVGRACVENAGTCKTNGGACTAVPYTTAWGPSGKGKINLVDFSNATYATIDGVNVYDHRRGDFTFKTGTAGMVRDSHTDLETPSAAQVDTWIGYAFNPSVTTGIVAGSSTYLENSSGSGWDAGVETLGWNTLIDVTGGGYGASSESTWTGPTGLLISSAGVEAYGFRAGSGLLNCVRPKFGLSSSGGYNFLVSNAYCDTQIGAKFIVQGTGNQYLGVRGAWAGVAAVVGLGDQRGRCASGSRSGKVCVFGAGDNATIGCPTGATCAAHSDFPAEGAGHAIIAGGGLLHSDQSSATMIRATDSKRCMAGDGVLGGPCTTNGDCGTGGSCQSLRYNQILVDGMNLYGGVTTGIDLSTSSVGVDTRPTYGGPSISGWTVSGVSFNGQTNGMKFPSLARYCVGGASAGTSCTVDSTCSSGGGVCRGPVENFVASGNMAGVTTPLTNWDESYGDVSDVSGLTASDNQGKDLSLTAGEALTKGQTVTISTAASSTVLKALTSNPEKVVGVVMADTLNGYTAKVRTQGIGYCIAHAAAGVTRGDLLKPSTTTAGAVGTGTTSDPLIGVAVETASANGTFRCLIGATAGIQSNATVFPKFADDGFFSTPVGYAACSGTPTTLATITHTATSGRTIRLQGTVAHDVAGAVTRVATVSIRRGGSNCSSGSPTVLVTSDTEMKSNENIASAIGVKDTGQSGSVTYRLCACADTGSSIEADNAMLSLTEY